MTSITITPASVSSVTHWLAIFSNGTPSNGSLGASTIVEGRVFAFLAVSAGLCAWPCAAALAALIAKRTRQERLIAQLWTAAFMLIHCPAPSRCRLFPISLERKLKLELWTPVDNVRALAPQVR